MRSSTVDLKDLRDLRGSKIRSDDNYILLLTKNLQNGILVVKQPSNKIVPRFSFGMIRFS